MKSIPSPLIAFLPTVLVFSLSTLLGGPALAAGGVVKLRTDNSPEGGVYNARGVERARYCAYYDGGLFDRNAVLCGIAFLSADLSTITPGVDDYILGGDLRMEDGNRLGYADLTPSGLLTLVDSQTLMTCSGVARRTYSFGGGRGVPDPISPFVLTAGQLPLLPFTTNDLEIRLDIDEELTNRQRLRPGANGGDGGSRHQVQRHGHLFAYDDERNPLE